MECAEARRMLQDLLDGRLPDDEAQALRRHLGACGPCATEKSELARVGELLRLWSEAGIREREPRLAGMWSRVRAGIDLRRRSRFAALRRRWLWIPAAAALAVLVALLYPSGGAKAPFHPKSFDVTVESVESDAATVVLVDKGENLPRVIWIIEHEKT